MSILSWFVELLHVVVLCWMVWAATIIASPLRYRPWQWSCAIATWSVVPVAQGMMGGLCPLTALSRHLSGMPPDASASLTRDMLGLDIPWWLTLSIGVTASVYGTVWGIRHRRRWQRYMNQGNMQRRKTT